MSRKTTETDKFAAAWLFGEGKRQTDIADILGLSQAVISRLLDETKDIYWTRKTQFLRHNLDEAKMHAVLDRVGKNRLAEAVRDHVLRLSGGKKQGPVVRVFSGGARGAGDRDRMAAFGRNSAPYVHELIVRSRSCGLTWGSMLWHLISALRGLPEIRKDHVTECIPLTAEPLGNSPGAFSSSSLAADLGRIVNGDEYHPRSIAMVPAFIPEGFTAAELRGVWKLIGLVPSYNEIFGNRNSSKGRKVQSIADRLDMILTSVGPAQKVLGFGASRLFDTGRVTIERLQQLVIGDMGGVCFPRPDLNARGARDLEGVANRWTGLTEEHLRSCSDRAAIDPAKPGVVVVSGGDLRALFIYGVLDIVNHLIIDEALAAALGKLLGL